MTKLTERDFFWGIKEDGGYEEHLGKVSFSDELDRRFIDLKDLTEEQRGVSTGTVV